MEEPESGRSLFLTSPAAFHGCCGVVMVMKIKSRFLNQVLLLVTHQMVQSGGKRGRRGGRGGRGGREEGGEGGEGGGEGGREEGREGGREGGEGGQKRGRNRGRERGREGGREGRREREGYQMRCIIMSTVKFHSHTPHASGWGRDGHKIIHYHTPSIKEDALHVQ